MLDCVLVETNMGKSLFLRKDLANCRLFSGADIKTLMEKSGDIDPAPFLDIAGTDGSEVRCVRFVEARDRDFFYFGFRIDANGNLLKES